MIKNLLLKLFNNKKYNELKFKKKIEKKVSYYNQNIKNKILEISNNIEKKNELNFLHSGHLGDLIYSLSLLKEISKSKKRCNLLVEVGKKNILPYHNHPSGDVFINKKSFDLLLPLLKKQNYINSIKVFKNENIDIDLNFFREMPFNIIHHSMRWYSHLAGIPINMHEQFLEVEKLTHFENKISIIRTQRYQNEFINYKFLSYNKDLIFIGLYNEFLELKKEIKYLEFYNCKDFLEMASIIRSSKFFIGNLCFGFSIAEALKKPRLLEACPNFPVLFPIGENAYDFYHQLHFEKYFKILNDL